jgi:hypothetical protein
MSAYQEAVKRGRKTGASNAATAEVLALFCYGPLQTLVGAVSPELMWAGAMAKQLTVLEFGRLCANPMKAAELQWLDTVTVTPYGRDKYHLEFSRLPGKTFGPYDLQEARGQLETTALLAPVEARAAVLDARALGVAVREMPRQ